MKYLMLFERFDSTTLRKTLSFIDSDSVTLFLDDIKRICDIIDFPYSELSDDFFEYLNYNKAINKDKGSTPEYIPCEATSKDTFHRYGIDGEKCEGGKIKRKWGSSIRIVDCPFCKDGLIEVAKSPSDSIEYIKFWFDVDGKYIFKSATSNHPIFISNEEIDGSLPSDNISDYNIIKNTDFNNLRHMPQGTLFQAYLRGITPIICYLYKAGYRRYALQNALDGSTPSNNDWRKISKYTWNMGEYGEHIHNRNDINILEYKYEDKDKDKDNKKKVNNFVLTLFTSGLRKTTGFEDKVKGAHFSIVLDYEKLKNSKYLKKTDIKKSRHDRKIGATSLRHDDDIRKENVDRYLREIFKKREISDFPSSFSKVIKSIVGNNILYNITYSTRLTETLNSLHRYYYLLMNNPAQRYIDYINDVMSDSIRDNHGTNLRINRKINFVKRNTSVEDQELLIAIENLNKLIYDRFIKDQEFNNINDISVLALKIGAVKDLIRNSSYNLVSMISVTHRIYSSDGDNITLINYLTESRDKERLSNSLESLEIIEKTIKRL